MKITMYELLGLVKDGKAPKRIKFRGIEWEYKGYQYTSKDKVYLGNIWNGYNFNILNDKVEILVEPATCEEFAKMFQENCKMFKPEEKKIPKKIDLQKGIKTELYELATTINSIIDYLESKGE